jgi:hypothetical protein
MKWATLVFALTLTLTLAACGGGNNAASGNSSGGSSCTSGNAANEPAKNEPAKPDPAKDRQAVADALLKAYTTLDSSGVPGLFTAEEQDKAKSHIVNEIDDIKKKNGKVTVQDSKIEEKEGKFFLTATLVFDVAGEQSTKTRPAQLIQKDGKWYVSFNK